MNREPKISTVEIILLLFFALIADLINWIPIVNIISAVITFTISQIYFRLKGVKAGFNIIMQLLEVIPGVSVLPLVTAGVIGVIIVDRNPKVLETAGEVAGATPLGAVASQAQKGLEAQKDTLGGASAPRGTQPSPQVQKPAKPRLGGIKR